jgi:glycogen debranching enzyme
MRNPTALLIALAACAVPFQNLTAQIAPFPASDKGLVISRPVQPQQPFTVAGTRGVVLGTQDGQFESWILPVKLLSHLTIEANVEGYTVPIDVNAQAAQIEVRPDHTTITYSHIAFTLRQIMFSPDASGGKDANASPSTGPIVLFQIDCNHPIDLVFRFTPELRWMWPKRNDGIPGPEWVTERVPQVSNLRPGSDAAIGGYFTLHMDYPDLAGAVTIPTATPGILAPYQERPQVHPLELHLHYDPKRDGQGTNAKLFPLLMAVGTSKETATNESLGRALEQLNAGIPEAYKAHAAQYEKQATETTSIQTPDKALNEAFNWGVVSIEQLKAHEYKSNQDALVAGYYQSADSARPGFGWFFGRDALYTLYAVNGFGDFALTRSELEFLIARQRADGKIMHEFSQTAGDPTVDWKSFPYMYAAADATPLFLMAMRDYYRASGDLAFLQKNRDAIEKAWAFETAPTSDTDHDGIYDNSQGTGWVESWPHDKMPHQEVYLALLDEQASLAYADLAQQFASLESAAGFSAPAKAAKDRASKIAATIEKEYYDPQKGCYAFSHNTEGDPNGATDRSTTVYPAIAWWDSNLSAAESSSEGAGAFRPLKKPDEKIGALAPEGPQPLAHASECLTQFASPTLATDWGLRDVATTEPFYDGMSYHQGSVWPLFTGWAALAEYRGNQPLAGEQMLMQNVDLTWAQDPGAVTELLSGDFFVPFGRSTSHQLWSSAMVITPTLRGLFGINLDAATNTITVNPHLPAIWDHAEIKDLHLGSHAVYINIVREHGEMNVSATTDQQAVIELRSPPVELDLTDHALPTPGSRTADIKIISTAYGPHSATILLQGTSDTDAHFLIRRNKLLMPRLNHSWEKSHPGTAEEIVFIDTALRDPAVPMRLDVHFPTGEGYQTAQVTLAW